VTQNRGISIPSAGARREPQPQATAEVTRAHGAHGTRGQHTWQQARHRFGCGCAASCASASPALQSGCRRIIISSCHAQLQLFMCVLQGLYDL